MRNGGGGAQYAADQYNRGLEKSIGQYDVTHDFKFSTVYDLPFGRGQKLSHQRTGRVDRGQLADFEHQPLCQWDTGCKLRPRIRLPIYAPGDPGSTRVPAYVTSYNGWQPSYSGKFDPSVDNFFVPYCGTATATCSGPFPYQGSGSALNTIGNETRYNPKLRLFPNLNENMSLTKTFPIKERIRMEFRAEAFNVFNRVRFGTGSTQLQSQTFGVLTGSGSQINTPRNLQLGFEVLLLETPGPCVYSDAGPIFVCPEHVRQLVSESPFDNVMEVKSERSVRAFRRRQRVAWHHIGADSSPS